MPRGSLYDIIHDKQYALTMEMKISFILDMIKGLQYIISAGMLHRDLKSMVLISFMTIIYYLRPKFAC